MAIRAGAVSVHFFELIGLSAGTTIIVIMIVEECIEIYKNMKLKRRLQNETGH